MSKTAVPILFTLHRVADLTGGRGGNGFCRPGPTRTHVLIPRLFSFQQKCSIIIQVCTSSLDELKKTFSYIVLLSSLTVFF